MEYFTDRQFLFLSAAFIRPFRPILFSQLFSLMATVEARCCDCLMVHMHLYLRIDVTYEWMVFCSYVSVGTIFFNPNCEGFTQVEVVITSFCCTSVVVDFIPFSFHCVNMWFYTELFYSVGYWYATCVGRFSRGCCTFCPCVFKGGGSRMSYRFYVSCGVLFTDVMALLSPSRCALHLMLNICCNYCGRFCPAFNVQRHSSWFLGNYVMAQLEIEPLLFNEEKIEMVTKWWYLGFHIVSGKGFPFQRKRPKIVS